MLATDKAKRKLFQWTMEDLKCAANAYNTGTIKTISEAAKKRKKC